MRGSASCSNPYGAGSFPCPILAGLGSTRQIRPHNPTIANLNVGALDSCPGDTMGGLLLARLARMRRKRVIKGGPVNTLRMRREVLPDRGGKRGVCRIGHDCSSFSRPPVARLGGAAWDQRWVIILIRESQGHGAQSVNVHFWHLAEV